MTGQVIDLAAWRARHQRPAPAPLPTPACDDRPRLDGTVERVIFAGYLGLVRATLLAHAVASTGRGRLTSCGDIVLYENTLASLRPHGPPCTLRLLRNHMLGLQNTGLLTGYVQAAPGVWRRGVNVVRGRGGTVYHVPLAVAQRIARWAVWRGSEEREELVRACNAALEAGLW